MDSSICHYSQIFRSIRLKRNAWAAKYSESGPTSGTIGQFLSFADTYVSLDRAYSIVGETNGRVAKLKFNLNQYAWLKEQQFSCNKELQKPNTKCWISWLSIVDTCYCYVVFINNSTSEP